MLRRHIVVGSQLAEPQTWSCVASEVVLQTTCLCARKSWAEDFLDSGRLWQKREQRSNARQRTFLHAAGRSRAGFLLGALSQQDLLCMPPRYDLLRRKIINTSLVIHGLVSDFLVDMLSDVSRTGWDARPRGKYRFTVEVLQTLVSPPQCAETLHQRLWNRCVQVSGEPRPRLTRDVARKTLAIRLKMEVLQGDMPFRNGVQRQVAC